MRNYTITFVDGIDRFFAGRMTVDDDTMYIKTDEDEYIGETTFVIPLKNVLYWSWR